MRREVFGVLFILVVVGFFYSPSHNGISFLGCAPSCEPQQETTQTPTGENCFSMNGVNELYGEVPAGKDAKFPASYTYENFGTTSWKFDVENDLLSVQTPQMYFGLTG